MYPRCDGAEPETSGETGPLARVPDRLRPHIDRLARSLSYLLKVIERLESKGTGLVHHWDRGSQHLSIKYTERLAKQTSAQLWKLKPWPRN